MAHHCAGVQVLYAKDAVKFWNMQRAVRRSLFSQKSKLPPFSFSFEAQAVHNQRLQFYDASIFPLIWHPNALDNLENRCRRAEKCRQSTPRKLNSELTNTTGLKLSPTYLIHTQRRWRVRASMGQQALCLPSVSVGEHKANRTITPPRAQIISKRSDVLATSGQSHASRRFGYGGCFGCAFAAWPAWLQTGVPHNQEECSISGRVNVRREAESSTSNLSRLFQVCTVRTVVFEVTWDTRCVPGETAILSDASWRRHTTSRKREISIARSALARPLRGHRVSGRTWAGLCSRFGVRNRNGLGMVACWTDHSTQ